MKEFFAHSARDGTTLKHGLKDHLESTAKLAQFFAQSYDPEQLVTIAGLLHDLGKYYHEFQKYLDDPAYKRKYRDHSSAGAVYTANHFNYTESFILAMLIFSHHTGLIAANTWMNRVEDKKDQPFVQESLKKAETLIKDHTPQLQKTRKPYFEVENTNCVQLEMRIRMLFSALVDADFLDTEQHFSPEKGALRAKIKSPKNLFHLLESHYTAFTSNLVIKPINRTRSAIFQECLSKAHQKKPFYLLNVPTGLGKTLSSMGFALKHATYTHKKRVIVALPFMSVIDQNTKVFKEIFGEEQVLEHHSQVDWKVEQRENNERWKLAAENWDAPIIITSTVQLFESLFANKTSSVRKLHNIVNSVVILDEFQMLPIELLEPIFSTMEELMNTYNVTFVVSSATPLSFKWKDHFRKVGQPISLIEKRDELFEQYHRIDFQWWKEQTTWHELSNEIKRQKQSLTIVNTKENARNLYQSLNKSADSVYHLSTMMCSKHRRSVLDQVKLKIEKGLSVHLVSTQLIEAGVDIDFPIVYRALAPLDSIIQAAGRCNREGNMLDKGQVVIFEPKEGGMPSKTYRMATDLSRIILRKSWDALHLPQTYTDYFQELFYLDPKKLDKKGIQARRIDPVKGLDFPEMARDFQMIEKDTVSIVCPYDDIAKELIEKIQNMPPNRNWFRQIQPYVVNITRTDTILKEQPNSFKPIADDWYVLRADIYDQSFGLNRTTIYPSSDLIL